MKSDMRIVPTGLSKKAHQFLTWLMKVKINSEAIALLNVPSLCV